MSGSLWGSSIARLSTVNGNTVGIVDPATGYTLRTPQTKLDAALKTLDDGIWPFQMVVVGDSTGDATDEFVYLLAQGLAARYTDYTVNYRLYSNANTQYEGNTNLSTGSAGLAYFATGTNANNYRYTIADSVATSITGDIDVRVKLALNGALPSATMALGGKYGAAGVRSWFMEMTTTGTLTFNWSVDGTALLTKTSTAAVSELSSAIWVRATLDVDNGAAGNTVNFYTSTDGSTWTALGAAVVTATATSIFDSTSGTQFIGRSASSIAQQDHDIHFYNLKVYSSLTGAGRVIDIDAGGIMHYGMTPNAIYDDIGNTLTLAGAYGTFAGSPRLAVFNGSVGGAAIAYTHTTNYATQILGKPSLCVINYGHNDTADVEYRTDYKTLTDALLVTNPDMAIVAMTQNRRIVGASTTDADNKRHAIRMDQVRKFAASQGFYVLDLFSNWLDANTADEGIHPNAAGKLVAGGVVKKHFGV